MADMEWVDEIEGLLGKRSWEAWTRVRTGTRKLIVAVRLAYKKASSARANVGSRKVVVEELEDLRRRLRSGEVE